MADAMAALKPPPFADHRAWAEYWGREALVAIGYVHANPGGRFVDLEVLHAVQASRIAFSHAARLKGYRYWDDRWREEQS